ncbi:hypothetical protein VitviT2T_010975 [Vitis vinifera]|uniref:Exonuclease domain-containing protein n=2 Tax=Vitis vinifera TaxID=29760 RepID=A0ABY9CB23_VITVI|nr:small RNA degrading nuclease 1 [Vitis vinifera]WJZ91942.1 hypothetical protein VitviT2T_010975 [Vitis vinifera]|eukprot:XP_010652773.1 PREDICTED: small RNA degrading nuclease 1 [Vitis vinifera]
MDNTLVNAEKEVLVEMVKLAQKRGLEGSKGSWKDFLSTYDRKLGPSLSDPSRRPVDTLVSFLKTFSKEEDLKFFAKILQCYANRKVVEEFKTKSHGKESPEQRLIRLTLEHPQYPLDYSFPSHEEGWMVTKIRQKFKFTRSNAMLAVDCEMVLCEDGTEGLVRVCVVDRNLQVKLNELVKPHKAVVDYRTEITGVSAKDFDETTSSLVDIQRSMKKLLSHGAVLVGHSLHNDLKALKLDHARVIDTAFIYKYENQPINRRPSLNNLCKSILGYEVRQKDAPHNCLDDASAAMKLVLAKLEQGLDDAIPFVHEDVPENEMAKLLLHRIPTDVPIEELNRIIPGEFTMEHQPRKKVRGEYYSALAIFRNSQEAYEAFENIRGTQGKDSSGRSQKSVSFQLGTGATASLYVRKMAHNDSLGQVSSRKRSPQVEEISGDSKKLKTEEKTGDKEMMVDTNQCEDHMKEIERLKAVLSQRDNEISTLHKIITSLTRKQGL